MPPRLVAHYLVSLVDPDRFDPASGRHGPYAAASIRSAVTAIRAMHVGRGMPTPTDDPMVRAVLKGATRIATNVLGRPVQQAALLPDDLRTVLDRPSPFSGLFTSERWLRTQAWVLLAFHLNLRHQDWAALRWGTTLRRLKAGWLVVLGDGKTRTKQERFVVTPAADPALCPVSALDAWAAAHNWLPGSLVFRSLRSLDSGNERPLTHRTASDDLRAAYEAAGLPSRRISTHSARRGFAVTACRIGGLDPIALAKAGRWKTVDTALGYANEAGGRTSAHARNTKLQTRP